MIHQYKLNGFNIVLDICSGSVHAVDEIAYDIIAMFEGNDKNHVIEEVSKKYLKERMHGYGGDIYPDETEYTLHMRKDVQNG